MENKNFKNKKKFIDVGVASIDFDLNSINHYKTCGWYCFCFNLKLCSGPPFNYYNKDSNLSQINNEITIIMNMKKKSLKFKINNEDKGDS